MGPAEKRVTPAILRRPKRRDQAMGRPYVFFNGLFGSTFIATPPSALQYAMATVRGAKLADDIVFFAGSIEACVF